jgi:hypothetical protein
MPEARFKVMLGGVLLATAGSSAIFPFVGMVSRAAGYSCLAIFNAFMLCCFIALVLRPERDFNVALASHALYLFQGSVFALLIISAL